MIRSTFLRSAAVLTLLVSSFSSAEAQGRVFVNNDEWTLDQSGISHAGNVTQFTRNLASWLTGGTSGSVLIASGNFGFPTSAIGNDLSTGGYTFSTTNNNSGASLAVFTGYSAVFVDASTIAASSNAQLQADLQSYVLGGGSVFVNLGTGVMSSANEAAAFNTFLGHFGIQAAASYNGIGGVHNTSTWSSAAPYGAGLFGGVSQLYSNNGNSLSLGGPNGAGYTAQIFGDGLYAASARASVVPEPSTVTLLVVGLAAVGLAARRRRA